MTTKKDFQNVIGKIRKELGGSEYPKAMMTGRQMMNDTATVNCWGSRERADAVLSHPLFIDFLKRHGATAHREEKNEGWSYLIQHIRVIFPEKEAQA